MTYAGTATFRSKDEDHHVADLTRVAPVFAGLAVLLLARELRAR